jgi:hypothetical protein
MAANTAPNNSKHDKLLARTRRNPRGDWRIEQLRTIADRHHIPFRQPGTSHVIFAPPGRNVPSVPARRPIKPVYIRQFVAMIDVIRADETDA